MTEVSPSVDASKQSTNIQMQNDPQQAGSATPNNCRTDQNRNGLPPALCDRCNEEVNPVHDTFPNLKTHLIALILFLIGLPFLIFIPYCFDCFGTPVVRCPKCGSYMNDPNQPQPNTTKSEAPMASPSNPEQQSTTAMG